MDDKELTDWTVKLFSDAVQRVELPKFSFINPRENGLPSFVFFFRARHGTATVIYSPDLEELKDIVASYNESSKQAVGEKMAANATEIFVVAFFYGLVKNLHINLFEGLSNAAAESLLVLSTAAGQVLAEVEGESSESKGKGAARTAEARKQFDDYFEKQVRRKKARLLDDIHPEKVRERPKHLISYFYAMYHSAWKDAKKCYRANKSYASWPAMVAAAHPTLPSDLIERLGEPDPYTSMPSAIALEHAARACGLRENSLGIRALQDYLNESRKWLRRHGVKEEEKELSRYFDNIANDIAFMCQISDSLGKEPNLKNLPYLHQEFARILKDPILEYLKNDASDPRSCLQQIESTR